MLQLDRHVPSPGVSEFNRRFGWLLAFLGVAFLLLVGRLWQLQILRGDDYYRATTDNFEDSEPIPAVRGKIKDRNGVTLVDNRPAFDVYIVPKHYTPALEERLTKLLNLDPREVDVLRARVAKGRARDPKQPKLVLGDVSRDRLAIIEQSRDQLPGLDVRDFPHREYLHGTLAAHVLGYMNRLKPEEIVARTAEGYEDDDYIGRAGIENQWESHLRGKKGIERFVEDAHGRRKDDKEAELLIKDPLFVPPVPGNNVVLTLDVELQRIAERSLRNLPAGAIAVVEVETGRILALVSKPAFDPNVMTGKLTDSEWAQIQSDPFKPLVDKTLQQHYYPGSTYKFVVAAAALEEGIVGPDDKAVCHGKHELGNRCTKSHGPVRLDEAMAQSCNVYFWNLAEKVGIDKMAKVARDFGFGAPTGLGLNGDVPGRVPWKGWYEARGGYRVGYALNTAVGQGDTDVTVVQLALAYAALANGGKLWVPQLVQRVETASGETVADFPPALRRKIELSERTLDLVAHSMWGTVADKKGTAHAAAVEGLSVAGKTGTAQVRKLIARGDSGSWNPFRDHAWFAGWSPTSTPEISVVVLAEHGGKGGGVAAPIAMEIVKGWEDLKAVRMSAGAPPLAPPAGPVAGTP